MTSFRKGWFLVAAVVVLGGAGRAQESADTLACDVDAMLDLSTIEHLPGELILEIKEGNDELVDQLRGASEQGCVVIGRPSWDKLSADLDLIRIEAFTDYTEFSRRLFVLIFPEESDLHHLIVSYCSLPYVKYVVIVELYKTAITRATWGMVKHCRSVSRFSKAIEDME